MKKNSDAFISTFPLVWVYTIVLIVAIYFILNYNYASSFLLGSVTSLMAMSMLYKNSKKVLQSDVSGAQKMASRSYAFRYLMYAIILIASAVIEDLEVLATAFGLLSFKIVLYFNLLVLKRGENK